MRINHSSPVWTASWAHPEYGTYIALAGYDAKVTVYKWNNSATNKAWQRKCDLTEANEPVTAIEFAPQEYFERDRSKDKMVNIGLCLAVSSQDGYIRFYNSSTPNIGDLMANKGCDDKEDVLNGRLIHLDEGEGQEQGQPQITQNITSISWSRSWNPKFDPLIAVGCGFGGIDIASTIENQNKIDKKEDELENAQNQLTTQLDSLKISTKDDPPKIPLTTLNRLKIYKQSKSSKNPWEPLTKNFKKTSPDFFDQPVNDVCFASTSGRTFHLLAVAADSGAKLLKLSYENQNSFESNSMGGSAGCGRNDRSDKVKKLVSSEIKLDFSGATDDESEFNQSAKQVKFNMAGTMLSVIYEYGRIVVFQQSVERNRWIVSTIV